MACQTGIGASSRLSSYLTDQNNHASDRLIMIQIQDEELQLIQNRIVGGKWDDDWDRNVPVCIEDRAEDRDPCYIIYRLDTKLGEDKHYQYAFIMFIPENASSKHKMLYAATNSTIKRIFGEHKIYTEYRPTTLEEVSLQGYKNHTLSANAKAPMTDAELELEQVSKGEAMMRSEMSSHSATLPGLSLPATQELEQNINKFNKGFVNYLQIKLDTDQEELKLWDCSNINPKELQDKIPADEPRYHLYNYNHTHEGDNMWKVIFIYSCPGYNVPVKQRMMYSSTKHNFLESLAQMGTDIAAKTEVSGGDDLKEADIYELVHPPKHVSRQNFIKPKAPSKGGRRLIR